MGLLVLLAWSSSAPVPAGNTIVVENDDLVEVEKVPVERLVEACWMMLDASLELREAAEVVLELA